MSSVWCVLLLFLHCAELRYAAPLEAQQAEDAGALPARSQASLSPERSSLNGFQSSGLPGVKRVARGAKDGGFRKKEPVPANSLGHPRRYDDPSAYFTTPRTSRVTSAPVGNHSSGRGSGLHNPLFPVTDGSYWAYAVMLLALVLFAAGIVGNLALMCIVWHNFYLKSAWNSILAGLAFWDFLVLFFCLPVVIFHELTLKRLLGDLSCRLVPYLEVRRR